METFSTRPLAVVTGGSNGIGLELAKLFAQNGFDLIIAAEDPEGLSMASRTLEGLGATVEAVPTDLATYDGVEALAQQIGAGRPVEALALNAGVGLGGPFVEQDLDEMLNVAHLNVVSTVHLARRVLPGMVAQGRGRVLVTASIAALMPGTFEAVYAASKAFVHSFAEAVRNELKDTGVTVTSLQPGPTETNFFHRADMDDTKAGAGKKDDAAQVAQDGFDALMAGADHVVAGSLKNKVQAAMTNVIPDTGLAELHRGMTEPGSAQK